MKYLEDTNPRLQIFSNAIEVHEVSIGKNRPRIMGYVQIIRLHTLQVKISIRPLVGTTYCPNEVSLNLLIFFYRRVLQYELPTFSQGNCLVIIWLNTSTK